MSESKYRSDTDLDGATGVVGDIMRKPAMLLFIGFFKFANWQGDSDYEYTPRESVRVVTDDEPGSDFDRGIAAGVFTMLPVAYLWLFSAVIIMSGRLSALAVAMCLSTVSLGVLAEAVDIDWEFVANENAPIQRYVNGEITETELEDELEKEMEVDHV